MIKCSLHILKMEFPFHTLKSTGDCFNQSNLPIHIQSPATIRNRTQNPVTVGGFIRKGDAGVAFKITEIVWKLHYIRIVNE
jgi:hypothetical protein